MGSSNSMFKRQRTRSIFPVHEDPSANSTQLKSVSFASAKTKEVSTSSKQTTLKSLSFLSFNNRDRSSAYKKAGNAKSISERSLSSKERSTSKKQNSVKSISFLSLSSKDLSSKLNSVKSASIVSSGEDATGERKSSSVLVVEKHTVPKSDRTKLTAIRLIFHNQRFLVAFLDVITMREKREVYDMYEELEGLKKLLPQQNSKATQLDFSDLISTRKLLSQYYFHPTEVNYDEALTNEEVHESVMAALQPLLQYEEEMISGLLLYTMIAHSQNALLMELFPEYDEYVESKYFNQSRFVRTASAKNFNEEFEDCVNNPLTRTSSFSNEP